MPVLCVLDGVALSFATLWIDDAFDHGLIPQAFTGGPDAALVYPLGHRDVDGEPHGARV